MAADTSTAEVVRDRPETPRPEPADGPVASPPPAQPVVDFKDIASEITGIGRRMMPDPAAIRDAQMKATDARQDEMRRTKDRADTFALQVDATKKAAEAFGSEAAQRGQAMQPPNLPPTPSTGLRGFLASTKDEPAENAIAKLLQATSLFATMIGGGGRGGARASLSAFTGALEGWREGDRDRADRAFKQWKGETDRMLAAWETQVKGYETWLRSAGMPLEQKLRMLEVDAIANKNYALVDALRSGDADKALRALEDQQKAAIGVMEQAAKITASKEIADERMKNYREEHGRLFDLNLQKLDLRRQQLKQEDSAAYDPATLQRLGIERANGATLQELVKGFGRNANAAGIIIDNIATKVLTERGDPNARLLNASNLKANRGALADVAKKEANWNVFANTFEPAVQRALELSRAVDQRTGRPMFDKWLLRGRAEFQGDPQVAALKNQFELIAQEASRVVTRQGMTTEATRAEMRDNLFYAQSPEQLERIINDSLKPDVEYARAAFEREKKALQSAINTPPPSPTAEPAKPSGGTMQIRRKSDGKVFEGPSGPIPAGYEAVK